MSTTTDNTFAQYAINLMKTAPNFVKANFINGVKGFEAKQTYEADTQDPTKRKRIMPVTITSLDQLKQLGNKGDLVCGQIKLNGGTMNVGISTYNGIYYPKGNKETAKDTSKVMIANAKGNDFFNSNTVVSCQLFLWMKTPSINIDVSNYNPME